MGSDMTFSRIKMVRKRVQKRRNRRVRQRGLRRQTGGYNIFYKALLPVYTQMFKSMGMKPKQRGGDFVRSGLGKMFPPIFNLYGKMVGSMYRKVQKKRAAKGI